LSALKRELPASLHHLQQGNIAPVDLAQASIGPGMAIFSRYSKVIEADGSPMSVRTALTLINQALDEYLTEQEGDYDSDTRWALAWYEQHSFDEGVYGDAETLSKAKVTSVQGMVEAGFLYARAGKVRLLRREELDPDWNPAHDRRLTVWELTQHLMHALETRGVEGAARLLAQVGPLGDVARELAYRLYTLCERKGWAQEALAYNGLVVSWNDIAKTAAELAASSPVQGRLGV
jgi:putative DNA methylase